VSNFVAKKVRTVSKPRRRHVTAADRKRMTFREWVRHTSPNLDWDARHLEALFQRLDKVTSGECDRLMVFMPPRHGKSETVTVHYAAWRMEQDPTTSVIIGSHSQKLADRFSRKIKRIAAEPHSALRRRLNTASEWETGLGGGIRAVGVGGGITGFGANLVIIDDPVKSRAEAESKTYRERVWDWFNDDLYTRLEPDAAIILIQTRWHEDDLAGRLLKESEDGGEHWDVISLPALSEPPASAGGQFINQHTITAETPRRREEEGVSYALTGDTSEPIATSEPKANSTQTSITPKGVTHTSQPNLSCPDPSSSSPRLGVSAFIPSSCLSLASWRLGVHCPGCEWGACERRARLRASVVNPSWSLCALVVQRFFYRPRGAILARSIEHSDGRAA